MARSARCRLTIVTLLLVALATGGCRAEARTSSTPSRVVAGASARVSPAHRGVTTTRPSKAAPAKTATPVKARHATASVPLRKNVDWQAPNVAPRYRVRGAIKRRTAAVKALFARAGVAFPPAKLLLRVFKKERELVVWASSKRGGKMKPITRYEICAQGDGLGPKLREGDGKTPEGFYRLDLYHRASSYHLSMRISYPNRLDRRRGRTGSAILIHGKCVSIGCLAMTDARIEELWVMTRRRRASVAVHLYPARDMARMIATAKDAKTRAFWREINKGKDAFDKTHAMPRIRIRGKHYVVRARAPR